MYDNFTFITPEEAFDRKVISDTTLEEFQARADNEGTCDCGEPIWKLADMGMCFSCVTGEADPSDDYELR